MVVYTSGWDLVTRRIPGWAGPRAPGNPEYDRWLLSRFEAAIDVFGAHGARVVWLAAMCNGANGIRFPGSALDVMNVARLNDRVIRVAASSREDRMSVVDLFTAACPGGQFTNRLGDTDDARPDHVHFSPAGADWLAGWLGPLIVREAKRHTTIADRSGS